MDIQGHTHMLALVIMIFIFGLVGTFLEKRHHNLENNIIKQKPKKNKKKVVDKMTTEKEIAAGAGGVYAMVHVLGKEKGYFLAYFILTWQYMGGGIIGFIFSLPISIVVYIFHFLFHRGQ